MIRFVSLFLTFAIFTVLIDVSPIQAQSRLQAISKGASGGGEKSEEEGSSSGSGKKTGRMGAAPSGLNDVIFIGGFENYLPTKRYNARITVFAEPRKFLLGHRACTKSTKMRDEINKFFFKEDLKLDKKGRVDTTDMDKGVRKAIKKALKTKLEYFTSIYVISGRYNTRKIPKSLKGQTVTDCAGIIAKKAEIDKANK